MSRTINDPTRRMDFVYLYEVVAGNPNGNPDGDNEPRVHPASERLMITDVCVKRKIRDHWEAKATQGNDVYIRRGEFLNARRTAVTGTEKPTAQLMREHFRDVRLFGAVVPEKGGSGLHLRGPIALTYLEAVHEVGSDNAVSITRICQEKAGPKDNGKERRAEDGTFGQKHAVPYVLFKGYGSFVPALATESGVTAADLDAFWEALRQAPEQDISASKGLHSVRKVWVFIHDKSTGSMPRPELFDRIRVLAPKDRMVKLFSDLAIETNFTGLEGVEIVEA